MPRLAWRKTALTVLIALVGQLVLPTIALATDREFDTVLSGLPILPEKANEPFDAIDDGDGASSTFARENKYFRMPLRQFLNIMAKPEGINVTLVPMNLNAATLNRPLGVILRNLTKGEALALVLQIFELKAVQFNERTIIVMQAKENKEFGLKTRKIYRLTHTTPKKVKDFLTNSKALKAIINPDNVIPNEDGQSLLAIDTERNIALIDSVVSLVDQKPNKIEGRIPLSFLTGQEFIAAINQLGPDVTTRVNAKALYYSEKGRAMISYDTPDNIEFLRALAKKVDLPARQVLIDTSIMTVGSTFTREIGFKMNTTSFTVDSLDRLLNNNRLARHLADTSQLPASARITYLLTKTGAQTLASPKIRTLDGERANITIGDIIVVRIVSQTQQQAVTGQANVSQNVTPQEITTGVQLSVKPTIHHDKTVTLELTVSNETPTQIKDFGVDRSTTNSTSKLRVKDAETVILGGFINRKEDSDRTPIPFLGEVPILRSIFNANRKNKVNSELVLLITPYILEYFTNPRTGEAELPRLAGRGGEDPDQPGPEASPAPAEPKPADREPILRSPSGQPLVKNIYDKEKGSIILRKRSEAERLAAGDDKPTVSPTGDSVTLSRMDVDGPVVDRTNPVATFRPTPKPVGAENPVVAAPPDLKPAGPPMSNVEAAKEAALGAMGEQPLPLKSLGAVESKAVLDKFEKTVADTAEWKDGVVASRATGAPEKIQDYGVLGRLSDKVADAEGLSKQLHEIKAAEAASPILAAPPVPSQGDEARAAVAKMRQESAALRARTENREAVDDAPSTRPPASGPRSSLFNVDSEDLAAPRKPSVPVAVPVRPPHPPRAPVARAELGGADEALAQIRENLVKAAKVDDEDEEPVPVPVRRSAPVVKPVTSGKLVPTAKALHLSSPRASERVADLRAKAAEMKRVRDGVPAPKPVAPPPAPALQKPSVASFGAAKMFAGINQEPAPAPLPAPTPVRPVVSAPVKQASALRGGLEVLRGPDSGTEDLAEVERSLQLPAKPAIAATQARMVLSRKPAPAPEPEPEEDEEAAPEVEGRGGKSGVWSLESGVRKPAPLAPVAKAPAPVAKAPAPVAKAPAPVAIAPVPVAIAPAPVAIAPAPVAKLPAPKAPAPVVPEPDDDALFSNAGPAPAPVPVSGAVKNRFQQLVAARKAAIQAPAPVPSVAPKPLVAKAPVELPAPARKPVLVSRPVEVEAPEVEDTKPVELMRLPGRPARSAPVEDPVHKLALAAQAEKPAPVAPPKPAVPAPKPIVAARSLDDLELVKAPALPEPRAPRDTVVSIAAPKPPPVDVLPPGKLDPRKLSDLRNQVFAKRHASAASETFGLRAASAPAKLDAAVAAAHDVKPAAPLAKASSAASTAAQRLDALAKAATTPVTTRPGEAKTLGKNGKVDRSLEVLEDKLQAALRRGTPKDDAYAGSTRHERFQATVSMLKGDEQAARARLAKLAAEATAPVMPEPAEAPAPRRLASHNGSGIVLKKAAAALAKAEPEDDEVDAAPPGKPLAAFKSEAPKKDPKALPAELETDTPVALGDSDDAFEAKPLAVSLKSKRPESSAALRARLQRLSTEDSGVGAAVVGGDPIGSLARLAGETGPKPEKPRREYGYAPPNSIRVGDKLVPLDKSGRVTLKAKPAGLSRLKKLADDAKPAPPKPAATADAAPDEFDSLLGEAQKKLNSGM